MLYAIAMGQIITEMQTGDANRTVSEGSKRETLRKGMDVKRSNKNKNVNRRKNVTLT